MSLKYNGFDYERFTQFNAIISELFGEPLREDMSDLDMFLLAKLCAARAQYGGDSLGVESWQRIADYYITRHNEEVIFPSVSN